MRDRMLRALAGESVDATPIWLMRQAGRYLPGYRKLRESHGILEIARDPKLAVEVTLEPVRRFDLDAAIVFADIVHPLEGLGVDLKLDAGVGPVVRDPMRRMADLERLAPRLDAAASTGFVGETIRRAREGTDRPVLGFSASPFTLACYLIEGAYRRDFPEVRRTLLSSPEFMHALMKRLGGAVGEYLRMQERSGASVLQVFDTWAGVLSTRQFTTFVAPYLQEILAQVRVPTIYFSTGSAHLLPLEAKIGATALGVDWRVPLDWASRLAGDSLPVQGNLDPAALLAPKEALETAARRVLQDARGLRGHIFNLGHGVLPETDPQRVYDLVEFVHSGLGGE